MRIHTFFKAVAAGTLLALGAGCYAPHHHSHGPDPLLEACLIGACVGSTYMGPRSHPAHALAVGATAAAVYLAVESGHHHGHHCGCQMRWYGGYRAYYWGGHWEYYENGRWYVVEGGPGPGW